MNFNQKKIGRQIVYFSKSFPLVYDRTNKSLPIGILDLLKIVTP